MDRSCHTVLVLWFADSQLADVGEAVGCLLSPDLKALAKSLQINASSLKKADLIAAVVKHSQRKNVSSFFGSSLDKTEKEILKR